MCPEKGPQTCGIIGYVGTRPASSMLLEGLRRLEYRGYDSAGIAVLDGDEIVVRKKKGTVDAHGAQEVAAKPVSGTIGIAHTRWATHGEPSDENSHPHLDRSGRIAVVHNGVIENYDQIKQRLTRSGHEFLSTTDTEVLAHLIGDHYDRCLSENTPDPLTAAVEAALREIIGTYGIAVLSSDFPGTVVGARRGSPLIIGIGEGENFLTSDANAVVAHTRQVVFLNDYDIATVTADSFSVTNLGTGTADVQISQLEFEAKDSQRGDFEHFMLKEIYEQPQTVENTLRGRIDRENATAILGGLNMTPAELRNIQRIVITASGTSWHAALIGEYILEGLAYIPVEVEFAHEFCYRVTPVRRDTLVLVISQSGETADTLMALREAQRRGHKALAIVNVVGSTIAREADGGIYMHAGPEIGVASTKAFIATLVCLTLLAVHLGRMRMLSRSKALEVFAGLEKLPEQITDVLKQTNAIKRIALKYASANNLFSLGRGYSYPTALEGALKLKEISYVHAGGYSAAEMKHGPIALINENTPTIFLVPSDSMHDRTMSNLEMIRARKGPVIARATEGDEQIMKIANDVITIPRTLEELTPILASVPLQLFAYHSAVARGCDVDKPRNLAKSVTVL